MQTSAKKEVQLVIDGLKKIGVKHLVSSPGSRNAPLSIAFDAEPTFTVFVVPDERVAAFVALGIAQQTENPVAIACTSGSAPLNYFPAIAEAFYQCTPLIVLTADRPKEWINQGDGQTIMQENVYGQHVLDFAQLDPFQNHEDRIFFEEKLNRVLVSCNGKVKGPVHLNLPFSEPLYELTNSLIVLENWKNETFDNEIISSVQSKLEELLNTSVRPMVLLGQNCVPQVWNSMLEDLSKTKGLVVLNEHTSNVYGSTFIDGIDRVLNQSTEEELIAHAPDLLITFGNAVISKRIKRYLRSIEGLKTIRVTHAFPEMDTYQSLALTIQNSPEVVLAMCHEKMQNAQKDFTLFWSQKQQKALVRHHDVLQNTPFSDLWTIDYMMNELPKNTVLHSSNSSIIRYVLLTEQRSDLVYRCNRGTSGIDGSSSTAVGAALADPENLHVLITGDMSFFYDSNAFWIEELPKNLKIVVINNGGGDIFNIIPGPQSTPQGDRFFVAKHKKVAQPFLEAYGISCNQAHSKDEVTQFFSQLLESKYCSALEVITMNEQNSLILKEYFKETKAHN